MAKGLDELLSDEPADTPEVEETPQPEPEPEPQDGQPRDDHGRFASKQAGEEAQDIPAEPTPGKPIPDDDQFKGYLTEKRKRQEAEERLADLERKFQQLQQPPEPPAAPPSVWEDEQGYTGHVVNTAGQIGGVQGKLWASEFDAMRAHPDDFPEMKERFLKLSNENPALIDRAMNSVHPWEEAYKIAKHSATVEALGAVDLSDLEAKIEARVREEMMGQSIVPQTQPVVPLSLTGERNVGPRSGPAWTGPKSLEERLR